MGKHFLGSKITADGDCSHEIKRCLLSKKSYDQPRQHSNNQRLDFANKGPSSQSYDFSGSHVWIESWTIKKAECCKIDAFELWCWGRLLRVPWTARRSVSPKGNQSQICIGTTDAEAKAPVLWPPDAKSRHTGKDPDAGEFWGQHEKWATEDEMAPSTPQTWMWTNSGRQWRTEEPGLQQSMRLHRTGYDWVSEQ